MKNLSKNFLTLAVVFAPALNVYEFLAGTTLGSFLVVVAAISSFLMNGRSALSRESLKLFLVICALTFAVTAINLLSGSYWFDFTLMIHNMYSIVLCFFPLIIAGKGLNPKLLIRGLFVLGTFASLVIIWQRVMLTTTGSFEADIFLPWFEVSRDIGSFSISRPCAFFTEPAHFSIFMLPVFYVSLLYRNYVFATLFFLAILCSGSTTGFLILLCLIVQFVLQHSVKGHRAKYIFLSIFGSIVVLALILVLFPSIIIQNIDKLQETDSTSTTLRLFGPLVYYDLYGLCEILFGVSLNQLVNYVSAAHTTSEVYNYSNAFVYMLLSYGVFGFVYLVHYLKKLWKSVRIAKGFLIVFIGILASDQILFNMHFLYLAMLTYASNEVMNQVIKDREMAQGTLLKKLFIWIK